MDSTSLTLSIPTVREPPTSLTGGFGSPVTTYLGVLKQPDTSLALLGQRAFQTQPLMGEFKGGNSQAAAVARYSPPIPLRQHTAQLTIFYDGQVNVYDNVPVERAQAIMHLAGGGSTWSSNAMNPPASVATRAATSSGAVPCSTSSASLTTGAAPMILKNSGGGSPTIPLLAVCSMSKPVYPMTTRPMAHRAELPQAKRRSLVTFFEKRKDRARGVAPYSPPLSQAPSSKGCEGTSPTRDKSPSPCNSKVRTRSPSPATAAPPVKKRSPSPAQRLQSSGSENSSPSRRPGTPQKVAAEEQSVSLKPTTWRRSEGELAGANLQLHLGKYEERPGEVVQEVAGSPIQRL